MAERAWGRRVYLWRSLRAAAFLILKTRVPFWPRNTERNGAVIEKCFCACVELFVRLALDLRNELAWSVWIFPVFRSELQLLFFPYSFPFTCNCPWWHIISFYFESYACVYTYGSETKQQFRSHSLSILFLAHFPTQEKIKKTSRQSATERTKSEIIKGWFASGQLHLRWR